MKRFAVVSTGVALILMFAAVPSFAQNMSAGVKAGVDFSNFGGDVEGTDSKTGFSAGAFFGLDLHEYFRLQFEGQYVQKGMKESEDNIELKWKLDYIEFMIPATLTIPIQNSVITPRFYAGPAIALEMSCKLSGEVDGQSETVNCDEVSEASGGQLPDIKTKSLDIGVFFGGGVDIGVGNGAVTFDVLYNLGLSNINDIPGTEGSLDIKNKNIQILVGYRFRFGA